MKIPSPFLSLLYLPLFCLVSPAQLLASPPPGEITLNISVDEGEPDQAQINWSFCQDGQEDHYVIERSIDGQLWKVLTSIPAKNLARGLIDYHFTDKDPFKGSGLYRIKLVLKDFSLIFSEAKRVNIEALKGIVLKIGPNPSSKKINIIYRGGGETELELRIMSSDGSLMFLEFISSRTVEGKFSVNIRGWVAGVYHLELGGEYAVERRKIIVR